MFSVRNNAAECGTVRPHSRRKKFRSNAPAVSILASNGQARRDKTLCYRSLRLIDYPRAREFVLTANPCGTRASVRLRPFVRSSARSCRWKISQTRDNESYSRGPREREEAEISASDSAGLRSACQFRRNDNSAAHDARLSFGPRSPGLTTIPAELRLNTDSLHCSRRADKSLCVPLISLQHGGISRDTARHHRPTRIFRS